MAKKKTKEEKVEQVPQYDLFGELITNTPVEEENYSVKDSTGPFEIIDLLFRDKDAFNKLANPTIKRNAFMILRTFAIKYPIQASHLNILNINQPEVIRYLGAYLNYMEQTNRVPKWCYTKGSKKAAVKQDKKNELTKAQKEQYAIFYKCSMKDVEDGLKFAHDVMVNDILRLDQMLNPKSDIVEKEKLKR